MEWINRVSSNESEPSPEMMVQSSRMARFKELTEDNSTISTSSPTSPPNLHELQARVSELESILQEKQNESASLPTINPSGFVALLVDGDSDYFDAMYLKSGFKGGRSAADDLREKTQFYLSRQHGIELNNVEVLGYIFVNLVGLRAYLYRKIGISTDTLDEFVRGFNSCALMAAIDCGNHAQAAVESLKNWLSHYSKQSDCQYLLLGGAHNAEYAATLHQLSPEQRKKIIILRTSSRIAHHLTSFELPEACFSGLFDTVPSTASTFRAETAPFVPSNSIASNWISSHQGVKSTPSAASTSSTSNRASASTSHTSTRQIPLQFVPLVEELKRYRQKGSKTVLRATMGSKFKDIYDDNKYPTINNFASYAALAEQAGLVELGGEKSGGREWIALKDVEVSTILAQSSRIFPGIQIEPKFLPLVNLLDEYHRAGHDTVLRSNIGSKFTSIYKTYPSISNFAAYAHQAELAGLIVLGGRDSGGREWIALNRNPVESKRIGKAEGEGSVRVPENFALAPRIIINSTSTEYPFNVLLKAIRSYLPQTNVIRGQVAEKHYKSFLPIYKDPAFPNIVDFKTFSREAEKARYVRLTKGSTPGEAWISVRVPSPEVVKVVEAPIAPAKISADVKEPFEPLIAALQSYLPETRIIRSQFAAKYSSSFHHIYNDYKYNLISDFYTYCMEAELCGYVILTGTEGGESVISLVPALTHVFKITNTTQTSSQTSPAIISARTEMFISLITALRKYPSGMKVNSLNIQPILHQQFGVYSRVGSKTWEDYLEKAVRFGVVEIGGSGENDTQATNGQTWISLKAEYLVSS